MTKLQILSRINEMNGKSITLNHSLEVVDRVTFLVDNFEQEGNKFNMDQLIRDIIDEVVFDLLD